MLLFGWHVWKGESGKRYRFKIALTKAGLPEEGIGGVYVFVRRRWVFFLEPLYVGKATNFRSRLLGHEKWGRAYWYYGATERHVIRVPEPRDRDAVEEDLIRRLKPRMNDMMVPRHANDAPEHVALKAKWAKKQASRAFWFGAKARA